MSTPATAWPVKLPGTPTEFPAIVGSTLVETKSREAIERRNPAHDVAVSRYPRATAADVDVAVAAAAAAAEKRVWSGMSGAQRAKVLLDVARRIEENLEEFRRVESLECGKPVTNAEREVRGAIAHWEYAATLARHTYGDTYDNLGGGQMGLILREPYGVVAMITPWNYPLLIISQKLPFALAVGCCAVIKPSELTSGTTLLLGRILLEAGVPPGVVSVLPGYGHDVGAALCADPRVDMISFTGSTRVGKEIAAKAGAALKKLSLELGGKSAHIVCADADLETAAQKVVIGATRNAGQACVSGSRLLVERSIAREFLERVKAGMLAVRVGDPLDPATEMGPLISPAQFDRVSGYIAAGQRDGAAYWSRPSDGPARANYVQPGLFTQVDPKMSIAQEEIFGPVLSAIEFETVDQAIAIANGTPYGLSAGVWTRDLDKAFRFGRGLRAGTIEVNTYMAGTPELPLTGHKERGSGHERGRFAVDEFTELKTIHLQLN
jgi:acyl-CoA reductase-like NAD-dependent aldehyde dehydrogenase